MGTHSAPSARAGFVEHSLTNEWEREVTREIRLWVDPVRDMPDGFNARARDVMETLKYLRSGMVSSICLNHSSEDEKTSRDIALWIREQAFLGDLPRLSWTVNADEPESASGIIRALQSAEEQWRINRFC